MPKRPDRSPTAPHPVLGSGPVKRPRRRRVWLNVLPDDLWLHVDRGQILWEALKDTDVELGGDCGGLGKCGKCKIRVLSSIGFPHKASRKNLTEDELRQGVRLACRTRVHKDLMVHTGAVDPELEYVQILKTGERPTLELDPVVRRRLITLPGSFEDEPLADLERIRLAMGPEGADLEASLHFLQTMPRVRTEGNFQGAVVIHDQALLGWQSWEEADRYYGAVFDLGTSTLVGKLISLLDGTEIAAVSRLNSQIKFGTSVISRLQHVLEKPGGLDQLSELLVRDLNSILQRLRTVTEVAPHEIYAAVVAGNTTMQHLLLRLDPSGIAEAPFTPLLTDGLTLKSREMGLNIQSEARVHVMPNRSGYIGGDLIAALVASRAAEQDQEIVLGLDLGTNGEIFLGNRKRMVTCSAAAGPALEGARISHGMIAKAGAIEGVTYKPAGLELRIIGNIKPRGLCGSGLVDLVAILLHEGLIDTEGLIGPPASKPHADLAARLEKNQGTYAFEVAPAKECHRAHAIYLTQSDIRELQLAKGAIAAGIDLLTQELGITIRDVDRVVLAGALGNYVNPVSAMRIGLLPRVDPEIIVSLGNAASTGAAMCLLSKSYWNWSQELARAVEHVELSARDDFNATFVDHMNFPALNLW